MNITLQQLLARKLRHGITHTRSSHTCSSHNWIQCGTVVTRLQDICFWWNMLSTCNNICGTQTPLDTFSLIVIMMFTLKPNNTSGDNKKQTFGTVSFSSCSSVLSPFRVSKAFSFSLPAKSPLYCLVQETLKRREQIQTLCPTVMQARKIHPLIQDYWVYGEVKKSQLALTTKNWFFSRHFGSKNNTL